MQDVSKQLVALKRTPGLLTWKVQDKKQDKVPRNPKPEIRSTETRNPKLETRIPTPEIRSPKPDTRSPKPEIRILKPETQNLKARHQVWIRYTPTANPSSA